MTEPTAPGEISRYGTAALTATINADPDQARTSLAYLDVTGLRRLSQACLALSTACAQLAVVLSQKRNDP